MDIIRIDRDRVRVLLSNEELGEMDLDASSLSPDSPRLTELLSAVMEAVKEETGFSVENERAVVRASIHESGVTLMISHTRRGNRKNGMRAVRRNDTVVFEIPDFDGLCGLLCNIKAEYIRRMCLYIFAKRFYLAVPRGEIPVLIYEYSMHNRCSPVAESVAAEYGVRIAEGETLCKMADCVKKMQKNY